MGNPRTQKVFSQCISARVRLFDLPTISGQIPPNIVGQEQTLDKNAKLSNPPALHVVFLIFVCIYLLPYQSSLEDSYQGQH